MLNRTFNELALAHLFNFLSVM